MLQLASHGPEDRVITVTQLARELGVSARTLRFYEDRGLISPQRSGSTRIYAPRDRARMILILRGKRLGFSLREIKDFLDLYAKGHSGEEQLRLLRAGVKARLALLHEQRAALEASITELEDIAAQTEAALSGASEPRRAVS